MGRLVRRGLESLGLREQTRVGGGVVIRDLNQDFQSSCKGQYLAGRTVTVAKGREDDENAAGNDLYIKFSDVNIDHDYYGIRLSIHFMDPKTNTEIGSVPSRLYYEKRWFKFQLYMRAALDEVSRRKIEAEVTGEPQRKKESTAGPRAGWIRALSKHTQPASFSAAGGDAGPAVIRLRQGKGSRCFSRLHRVSW